MRVPIGGLRNFFFLRSEIGASVAVDGFSFADSTAPFAAVPDGTAVIVVGGGVVAAAAIANVPSVTAGTGVGGAETEGASFVEGLVTSASPVGLGEGIAVESDF